MFLTRACRRLCCCFAPVALLLAFVSLPSAGDKTLPRLSVEHWPVRAIGPANTGGRIVDLAIVESQPSTMYVAAATGGLWKTTDDGKSWTPLFDQQSTLCLGAVAVAPSNPDVVWVGTGEANILRSVSTGDGVFRSTDGGKSWSHKGLRESRHVGRIAIHPKNPDVVFVAAVGNPWGPNPERGLYKTDDAGKTWQHVLKFDDATGCIDVAIDPDEPKIVYATAYAVRRDAFSGTNPRSQFSKDAGLYKSEDGGRTWVKMTEGLPHGQYGRCGLDVHRKNHNIVYAVVQSDKTRVVGGGAPSYDKKKYITDKRSGKKKEAGDIQRDDGGIYRSEDKGKTWTHVNTLCPLPFFYGQIRIDPGDDQRIYVLGVSFHFSSDGGNKFDVLGGGGKVHADQHALWVNPKDPDHLVLGNDGGLYFSKDRGKNWEHIRGLPINQFYAIGVDMRKPYRVYGGTQDNGTWGGPVSTKRLEGVTLADWYRVLGADGFYCQIDPTDPDIVYAEIQYGGLSRVNLKDKGKKGGKGGGKSIKPVAPKGEPPYRFNWNAPILLSKHDPKTLYFGGNLLFKSVNQGDKWDVISKDLTRGGKMEDTGHTITTIAESPLKAGILYVGTDDGRLHLTRDDGMNWTELTDKVKGLPKDGHITRVECSHFAEGTAYLTVDRHRNNDFQPYVFKTIDHGETWKLIAGNLPRRGPVHVIRESSRNPSLLFAGTEFGVWVTLDGGAHWQQLKNGIPPAVLVHDLVIHPRERELVIGTHGRSIYVTDIAAFEEMTPKALSSEAHLCDIRPVVAFEYRKSDDPKALEGYRAANPAYGATIAYYLKTTQTKPVTLTVRDAEGKTVATLPAESKAGLHQMTWNLQVAGANGTQVAPGEYTVRLQAGKEDVTKKLRVEVEE